VTTINITCWENYHSITYGDYDSFRINLNSVDTNCSGILTNYFWI